MFDDFVKNFPMDAHPVMRSAEFMLDTKISEMNELLARFGGASFKHGLYRSVRASEVADWNARVCLGFPEFAGRIACFGYDWQGTAFATDSWRLEQGEPGVVMFDPGAGEALQVPANIRTFHEVEMVDYPDAALAANAYTDWRNAGGAEPAYDQCVGYKTPLFLNGKDDLQNRELSDLEVYWHLMGQLITRVKELPHGTPVRIKLD